MSGTLAFYVKMMGVAALDLWLGTGLAMLLDKFFKDKFIDTQDSPEARWKMALLSTTLQAGVTVISGDQLRNLLYPPNFDDPTGGIVFMMSILHQPHFWEKVDFVLNGIPMMVPLIMRQETNIIQEGEEKVIEPKPYSNSIFNLGQGTRSGKLTLPPKAVNVQFDEI